MILPREETKDFLVILLTSVTTFFMPVYGIICALLFVSIVDHIFGIWKAKQKKETISIIYGIWSTLVKGFLYSIILLSVFAVDKQVINDLITLIAGKQEISWIFTKIVALILFAIEAYSINRNYKSVKGVSLFTALMSSISGVKKIASEVGKIKKEVTE